MTIGKSRELSFLAAKFCESAAIRLLEFAAAQIDLRL